MRLTLVPADLAKVGHRFTFKGPNAGEECAPCPYQKLCFGLEPGRAYQVTGLRDVKHPCALHDPGKVRVAEVEEIAFHSSLEARHLRGTAAPWAPIACGRPDCQNYALCHPVGPAPGRHQIVADAGAMACPAGFELRRVQLRRMPDS